MTIEINKKTSNAFHFESIDVESISIKMLFFFFLRKNTRNELCKADPRNLRFLEE